MRLYVARHGETTWNVEGRLLGHEPGELTVEGLRQAEVLAGHVATVRPSACFSSDLKRCVEMAGVVSHRVPGLHITFTNKLRERNFGDLEGATYEEAERRGLWSGDPETVVFGAETPGDFTRRIAGFMLELAGGLEAPGRRDDAVVVLTHIGVMNRLNFLQAPQTAAFVKYPNAELAEFDLAAIGRHSEQVLANEIAVRD